MKRLVFIIVIIVFPAICSYGQESYIKDRLNVKAGYSQIRTSRSNGNKALTVGNYNIEANYGILNNLETGLYAGYSKFNILTNPTGTWISKDYTIPYYGINCNFHILPFLVKGDDFRFDLYLAGKVGGLYFTTPAGSNPHGHTSEYGIGAGVCFYLWKHLGLFSEYSYGNYYFNDNENFRFGLTFKFRNV
jgi:hypothetical protein